MKISARLAVFFFLTSFYLTMAESFAADITQLDDCTYRLSGLIERGDSEKFEETVLGCTRAIVYLDSPGGDLLDAIEISKMAQQISMVIDKDSQCLSACALVFMAGRSCSGAPYHCAPTRSMHKNAVLGFHAPFLKGVDPNKPVPVGLSFSEALALFSTIQDAFSEISAVVRQTGYELDAIPLSLMAKIFTTPPDRFFFIEDNDQFFSFGIDVFEEDAKEVYSSDLDKSHAFNFCYNLIYSELRGWNYSEFGLSDYEDGYEWNEELVTELYTRKAEPVGFEIYMRLNDVNFGPSISGWCHIMPIGGGYDDGYFNVEFYGEFSDFSGIDIGLQEVISHGDDALRAYDLRYRQRMHYSMALPLGTPIKNLDPSALVDPAAILLAKEYFSRLDLRHLNTSNYSAALLWVSERRGGVIELMKEVCGVEDMDIVSVSSEPNRVLVGSDVSMRACADGSVAKFKVDVAMVIEEGEWRVLSIRNAQ